MDSRFRWGKCPRSLPFANLIGATTYFFHVRAVNNHGNGAASTEVEVIAYDGPIPEPGAPPTLTATSGDHRVTLGWTAPTTVGASEITHYEYHQSLTSGAPSGTWTLVSGGGSALEVIVSNLSGATTYFFHVRAVNNHGNGAASTEVEVIVYDGTHSWARGSPSSDGHLRGPPGDTGLDGSNHCGGLGDHPLRIPSESDK